MAVSSSMNTALAPRSVGGGEQRTLLRQQSSSSPWRQLPRIGPSDGIAYPSRDNGQSICTILFRWRRWLARGRIGTDGRSVLLKHGGQSPSRTSRLRVGEGRQGIASTRGSGHDKVKEVKRGKKKRSARLDKVQYGERTCNNDSQTTISNEKDESKRQKRNNQPRNVL